MVLSFCNVHNFFNPVALDGTYLEILTIAICARSRYLVTFIDVVKRLE